MKTAILFCFVGAFLSAPTLGMIWFATEDLARSEEYGWSDLRTMFNLIRADLLAGQQVIIAAPSGILSSQRDTGFRLFTHWSSSTNNWIDRNSRLPYFYTIEGRAWNVVFDQDVMNMVSLETVEEIYDDKPSLRVKLTIRMDRMIMYCSINCTGTWRLRSLAIDQGYLGSYFPNVEISYEGRFHLIRGIGQYAGHWFLGPSLDQSAITVDHLIVGAVHIVSRDGQHLFDWVRELQIDGHHVNDMFRDVFTAGLQYVGGEMDDLIRRSFGNRPYADPQITLANPANNVSGFSCRKQPHRDRRETKLYN